MPELPEVEITRQGIAQAVEGKTIEAVQIRNRQLRWPIPHGLEARLIGKKIQQLKRRGKYILFHIDGGYLILHLGMSGSLCYQPKDTPVKKHEHVLMQIEGDISLRFCDPRRFGCLLWSTDPEQHFLLKDLGPEPLSESFSTDYLYNKTRKRKVAIKNFIMNSKIVVGVGNIYANEALFESGIRPGRCAARLSHAQCDALVDCIKNVLRRAISAGGTTLRDFSSGEGRPGYFQQKLKVYGRDGEPCPRCSVAIKRKAVGQRSSFYCPRCQT